MKIFQKLVWVVLGLYIAIIAFAVCTFQVDDMTLTKGKIYEYSTNWVMIREDGTSVELGNLPYSAESKPGEIVIIENIIPREYQGLTLSFLSADKTLKVYLDDEIIYEFGTNLTRIIFNVIILFAGVILAFLSVIQTKSHQSSNGMGYLSLFCITASIYYFIEAKW